MRSRVQRHVDCRASRADQHGTALVIRPASDGFAVLRPYAGRRRGDPRFAGHRVREIDR